MLDVTHHLTYEVSPLFLFVGSLEELFIKENVLELRRFAELLLELLDLLFQLNLQHVLVLFGSLAHSTHLALRCYNSPSFGALRTTGL